MGDFGPVVFIWTGAMHNGSKDLPMCNPITPQLVSDQLPGWSFLMLQHLTKETRCCSTVSTLRNENIDYVSILIDSSPQIEVLTSDFDEEFIDMPNVAESTLFLPQFAGIVQDQTSNTHTELPRKKQGASLSKQILDVSKAQREPMG